MNKLENIIAYFCYHYPHKNELSKARLTKLVYLADWFSALTKKKQITNIEWVFNHYGPYVDDITDIAYNSDNFKIKFTTTQFGNTKHLISYINDEDNIDVNQNEEKVLKYVIDKTKDMYFDKFIDFVYSTYPVKSKERYSVLNLEKLAKEYKKSKK